MRTESPPTGNVNKRPSEPATSSDKTTAIPSVNDLVNARMTARTTIEPSAAFAVTFPAEKKDARYAVETPTKAPRNQRFSEITVVIRLSISSQA